MTLTLDSFGLRPRLAQLGRQALPFVVFFAALVLLRVQLLSEMKTSLHDALAIGLGLGLYQDVAVLVAAATASRVVWTAVGTSPRVTVPLGLALIWLGCFANLAYFQYFGMRLDWWVVAMQWQDAGVVGDSSLQLGFTWPVVTSAIAALGAIGLAATAGSAPPPAGPRGSGWWRARPRALLRVLPLVLLSFALWRAPRALGFEVSSNIIAGNIVRTWLSSSASTGAFAGGSKSWAQRQENGAAPSDPRSPSTQLARYRDLDNHSPDAGGTVLEAPTAAGPAATRALDPDWPLSRELVAAPELTRALRRRFGLPETGPIHVILLFLESVRAFEVFHPELGPEVFPRLTRLFAERGIVFKQSYSSSFTAGQTVRGQFSVLCSLLPNMTGAAEYIAHTTLRVRCLQELLREQGYETAWMNGYKASYHNKQAFEMLHGTHRFFDETAFRARGVTQKLGSWGLADLPLLTESVRLTEELAAGGAPTFVNLLTISTHHPYSYLAEGQMPERLYQALAAHGYYRDYLSGLCYEDLAVQSFFDALFASPLAERTLVVVTGDHAVAVAPHLPLTPVQDEEMRFRVLTAIVTKNMPAPEVVTAPVHQVDIAPTIARTVGVTGPVTWVGQGLLSGAGRPWIYARESTLSYRTASRGCYAPVSAPTLRCYDVSGGDPLYDRDLPEVPEDPAQTRLMQEVVRAGAQAVVFNLLSPPKSTASAAP